MAVDTIGRVVRKGRHVMIPYQVERRIAGAIVLVGMGWWTTHSASRTPPPAPALISLTQAVDCVPVPEKASTRALEMGTCEFGGATATFATFASDRDRDSWILLLQLMEKMPAWTIGHMFIVEGHQWAISTGSQALCDTLARALHGKALG